MNRIGRTTYKSFPQSEIQVFLFCLLAILWFCQHLDLMSNGRMNDELEGIWKKAVVA
jgi:hypothetical protein